MNSSTRNILIIGGFATFVVIPLAIWSILSLLNSNNSSTTQLDLNSDATIVNAIEQYKGSDQLYKASNMKVNNKITLQEKWVIADIKLLDQEEASDSSVFRALLHSTGSQLELVGYTFDTFHAEDLPAGVPTSISDELNKPFNDIKATNEK